MRAVVDKSSGLEASACPNRLGVAFLAAGDTVYADYFWPVTDAGAQQFASTFYDALFRLENDGLAFLEARKDVAWGLGEADDLTAFSAVLFGDAASGKQPDLATAA